MGASAEIGGSSGNREGNNEARTIIDEKTTSATTGGARMSHGPRKRGRTTQAFASPKVNGHERTHHSPRHEEESAAMHPGKEILIGAKRSDAVRTFFPQAATRT